MFFEAGCDAAELLELAEVSLDEVAAPVELGRDRALQADAALGRDMRLATPRRHPLDQGQAIVAAVCDDGAGGQFVQKERGHRLVRGLSGRDVQPDRQAVLIDYGMDLGAQSATRTANGVILAPLFPPAACWWARTMELSINCRDCGDRFASSSKTFNQIPRLDQRLNRL